MSTFQVMDFKTLVRLVSVVIFLSITIASEALAAELGVDANTLLLLHCNGNLSGMDGETPSAAINVTYATGVHGQAVEFGSGNDVTFAVEGNLNGEAGTLEFWINPAWDGNDGQNHWVLSADVGGGILIGKDGGNFWRIILNRFGSNGNPELGAGTFITDWSQGEWHHAAFSWDATEIHVYVDGQLVDTAAVTFDLPAIVGPDFSLGSDYTSGPVMALIDELRISDKARTATEIARSFAAGLLVSDIFIDLDIDTILPTWWVTPEVTASTNLGTFSLPPAVLEWSSTDEDIADVDSFGRVVAFSGGTTTLTGNLNGVSDWIDITVTEPVLPPEVETIPASLSTPADKSLWEIPVVILRYLPTADGVNLDVSKCPDYWILNPVSLEETMAQIDTMDLQVKFSLEQGGRFRGYKTPLADPSIGYRVVKYVTVFEQYPPGEILYLDQNDYPLYGANHHAIFERFGMEQLVNDFGVKEIWIWWCGVDSGIPSYDPDLHDPEDFRTGWESNMSSPITGDISNSNRDNSDLPVYNRTYTVYGQNLRRWQNQAVHNRGHQYEAILSHVNWLQDGNSDLFWQKFVGQNLGGEFITGRSGWTHMPPNTLDDYDYVNMALVESDIEDWVPEGYGATTLVNASTWGGIPYSWPQGVIPPDSIEAHWYIYWMQAFPGSGNGIPYNSNVMTNWWTFVGDWDQSIKRGIGLYGSGVCAVDNDIVLTDQTIATGQIIEACQSISAGPNVIIDTLEQVRFISAHTVTLGSGFVVKLGATFSAEIDPTLDPY